MAVPKYPRFPDGSSIPLAAVALHGLQQQRQLGIDQLLQVFEAAGAVLVISAPKCKQCSKKRGRNGGQCVDWVPLRKHILPPELALLCPTRAGLLHGCQLVGKGGRVCAAADRAQGRQLRQGGAQKAPAARLPGD